MDTIEIVTLIGSIVGIVLGLYGATLSTILAIREKKKEKSKYSLNLLITLNSSNYRLSMWDFDQSL